LLDHTVSTVESISGLPPHVFPIEPVDFMYSFKRRSKIKVKLCHFPVILAYSITDYKRQSQTYDYVIVDLKKPSTGYAPTASTYVQFSRAHSLAQLSIFRPFDLDELNTPISAPLAMELEWQQWMAVETEQQYK